MTMRANERDVYLGGLMRCCTTALATTHTDTELGDRLACKYCGSEMYVAPDGNWMWARAAASPQGGASE